MRRAIETVAATSRALRKSGLVIIPKDGISSAFFRVHADGEAPRIITRRVQQGGMPPLHHHVWQVMEQHRVQVDPCLSWRLIIISIELFSVSMNIPLKRELFGKHK